jgi:transposase
MRGEINPQDGMFSYVSPERRVPEGHPLRRIKPDADEALRAISGELDGLYGSTDRPSIAPERLLKGQLLVALYSVRSDRAFCEQLDHNLLFRWFLDMSMDEAGLDQSNFSRLREPLVGTDVARRFFDQVLRLAKERELLSAEHFTVDSTLIESWASLESLKKKGGPPPRDGGDGTGMRDYRGERRTNDTHESTTDPEAKLMRRGNGQPAKLSYAGHALMENRSGLCADLHISDARLAEPKGPKPCSRACGASASGPSRSVPTRAITPGRSSITFVAMASARTSRASKDGARRGWMPGPRAMPVIEPVNATASASKRSSAGSRPSAGCARAASSASSEPSCMLTWRPAPTISCAWPGWRRRSRRPATRKRASARPPTEQKGNEAMPATIISLASPSSASAH